MLEKGKFDVTTEVDFPIEKFQTKGRLKYSVLPCLNVARFGTPQMIGGDILRVESFDFDAVGNLLYFPGRDCFL